MTSDAFQIVQLLFTSIWRLFTSFDIPGTKMTPAEWAFFLLFFSLFLRFLGKMLGGAIFTPAPPALDEKGSNLPAVRK